MTLVQLHYLVALDTHRHFRRAASILGVSQPALSTQINKLEEELGVSLFNRIEKPVTPTPVGEQVIAQARLILEETDRLKKLVEGGGVDTPENLRIGISSMLAPYLFASTLAAFRNKYKEVSVDIVELRSNQILDALKRNALDAGLVISDANARGVKWKPLFAEELVCFLSRSHPLFKKKSLALNDIDLEDVWLLKQDHPFRNHLLDTFLAHNAPGKARNPIQFECDSLEMLKRMVEENKGLTILPRLAVSGSSNYQPALIRRFDSPIPSRTVRLLYVRRLDQSPLLKALITGIQEEAKTLSVD